MTKSKRRIHGAESFKRVLKSSVQKLKSVSFWVSTLAVASLIFVFLLLWPNNKKISSPAIVASSDCRLLIPLRIIILDDHDIKLQFSLHKFLSEEWNNIAIQKAPGATDFSLVVNGKSTDSISNRMEILVEKEDDNYIHIEKDKIKSFFNFSDHSEFYFEYTIKKGLYRRNYSSFFVSLIYIPVSTNLVADDSLPKKVEVELQTPHNYVVSSSIPDPQKIFVIEDGVYYSYQFNRKETGILINLDNLSDAATKEILMLFLTTVFGFAIGFWLERWSEEKKKARRQKEGVIFESGK